MLLSILLLYLFIYLFAWYFVSMFSPSMELFLKSWTFFRRSNVDQQTFKHFDILKKLLITFIQI